MKILPDDLRAVMERDPAIIDENDAVKYHTGLHAVSMYRESHELWLAGRKDEARAINYEAHRLTGCDIHPGATIGRGFFVDHATGVVIGETAVVGDNVTLYQGVTLGGVSFRKGKRHPTVGNHVVIGANATVLGDIHVGNNVRIGAGSVVLKDVPDDCTVVGVPGKIIRRKSMAVCEGNELKHNELPDPVKDKLTEMDRALRKLTDRVEELERRNGELEEELRRKTRSPHD